MNKHLCPCCSYPLLRHISYKRAYWFCSQCHQEMPDIGNILEDQLYQQHLFSQCLQEYHPSWEGLYKSNELYCCLNTSSRELQQITSVDCLTQVAKQRCFEAYLDQEWQRMVQEQASLSVVLCELDFFKVYDNLYGHQAGNRCLQQVAYLILKAAGHPADLVARYGTEKFLIILPNSKAEGAVRVAQEIRQGVKALKIPQTSSSSSQSLTMSFGVASVVPSLEYSPIMLITATEQALHQAKVRGDTVSLWNAMQTPLTASI